MRIDLERTFSTPRDGTEDVEDWFRYFQKDKGGFTWSALHEKVVAVVVGEAGIGKTIEFENEAARLQRAGKPAFFVSLNQVLDKESWTLAVQDSTSDYAKWETSSDVGYFFFDAVDEARLVSHAALQKALSVIQGGLRSHLARVRIVISSRITDWAVEDVRETVRKYFVRPIEAAIRAVAEQDASADSGEFVQMPQENGTAQLDAFVVSLDPLSRTEALRLANAFQVVDATGFWAAVDDGDYEFMATRPLDLEWMVRQWNEKRCLGTYSQLIEGNISNRLTEVNPSYQTADAALSVAQLRAGAEQLAAAAEFSGRPFVSTATRDSFRQNEVIPSAVLSEWKPIEVTRLLASAVFDEATFCRVKFHHRSIREYLAASWLNRQIRQGLPFHRVLPLISASPFGIPVLISTRRATLCWLAAINVEAREWVTNHFPEMLLFEGDPEAWDAIAADRAFAAYVERIKNGLRTDWYNNASEFRRVGRRLPKGRVSSLLAAHSVGSRLTTSLLPLVKHGHLVDCAELVFDIYRNPASSPREIRCTLETLSEVASAEHRAAIKEDLFIGRFASNELISSALSVIDWQVLSVEQLTKVFQSAGSESEYGSGPMASVINEELLPAADADSAQLLLEAVVAALPTPKSGTRFARFSESDQPEGAWLLRVLPDSLERVLTCLPKSLERFPEVCLDAAERIEAIRHSGFADRDELSRLHALIADRPALRWQLALEIAQSEDIRHATTRLTWGSNCLVSFDAADLADLTAWANDAALSKEVRDIWFEVGMNLAFRELKGRPRSALLSKLKSGPDAESRATRIGEVASQYIVGLGQRRHYHSEDRRMKAERLAKQARNREDILGDIEHIRNGKGGGSIDWLIWYSFQHAGRENLMRVDFEVIERDFGQAVSEALRSGLIICWSKSKPPNPADYSNGAVPHDAIRGLAGIYTLLASGVDVASLSDVDASRAAKLAVWELNGPPSWFERLTSTHESAVCAALHPWIQIEASAASDVVSVRGALELSLRCPSETRRLLLQPLVGMLIDGRLASPDTLRSVLNALREDGLIASTSVSRICYEKVTASLNAERLITEIRWLRTWFEEDLIPAWDWFSTHVASLGAVAGNQVQEFASAVADCKWVKMPASEASIEVLLSIHRLLTEHMPAPASPAPSEEFGAFGHPITRLREAIPGVLVQVRGAAANRALCALVAAETDADEKNWLNARVQEHAVQEAQQSAIIEPAALREMGSPFLTEPRSEAQLFLQVVARLEEIRKGVEEGPFSDRDLFHKGMAEKHLQRWLAARFRDTQHRRFSIHREEEVDANNLTDIQLSCQYGNVCIEIKPVNESRGYSANTLVNTLRTQIVGQYLKGYNSEHGILVLFRLDKKTWEIPGGEKGQPFTKLIAYLQEQAMAIKAESEGVQELVVVGIDCVI